MERGICGTCARPATASFENEGYSDCCNDRIAYGLEASDVMREAVIEARANVEHFKQSGDAENAAWHQRQLDQLLEQQKRGF